MAKAIDERKERAAFVRWLKREHPGVSAARYGKPAQDQYIVGAVQDAWRGWKGCAERRAQRLVSPPLL